MKNKFLSMVKKEEGQGMVEYALIVGLIAVVIIAVMALLGPAIQARFTDIVNTITP